MKRAYKVEDMLDGNFSFGLIVKDSEGASVDLITSENAKRYIHRKYDCFVYLSAYYDKDSVEVNKAFARGDFEADFTAWKTIYGDNIQRMYDAMSAQYSPIENYDRMEEGIITDAHHKGSRTATARNEVSTPAVTTTTTNTPNLTTTRTATPAVKTKETDYNYGFDSASEVPASSHVSEVLEGSDTDTTTSTGTNTTVTTNEGTNTITAEATANYTETTDVSADVYDKDERTFNGYRVHGNIGVTESSTLVAHEVELRKINIAYIALDNFITEHCFYSSAVEVVE